MITEATALLLIKKIDEYLQSVDTMRETVDRLDAMIEQAKELATDDEGEEWKQR